MSCKRCQLTERLIDQLIMGLEVQYEIAPTLRLGKLIQAYAWELQKLLDRIQKIPEGAPVEFPNPPLLELFSTLAENPEDRQTELYLGGER